VKSGREAAIERPSSRLVFALVLALAGAAACRPGAEGEAGRGGSDSSMTTRPIAEVLSAHTPDLLSIQGVVGTAEGEYQGKPVFVILVRSATPRLRARLPRTLEGYPVEIRETGTVRALDGR